MKHPSIIWLWLIFACLFLALSCFYFIQSKKKIEKFQVSKRPLTKITVDIAGADIDKSIKDFVDDFNTHL